MGVTRPPLVSYRASGPCTLEPANLVSEAPFLVEHRGAHPARADLRRMRHARGRSQGLVLYPPRAGGDGAAEGRGAV